MWRQAVWPAVWPAAGLAAVIWVGRPFAGSTLPGLAALLVVAGLVYEALFVGLAISPGNAASTGRSWGNSRVAELAGAGGGLVTERGKSCVQSFSRRDGLTTERGTARRAEGAAPRRERADPAADPRIA